MRTVLSLVFLATVLWFACTVKLGAHTLAEHVDKIGQTDEAKALLDGSRQKISPVLEDMKQRVLGEYVEAPTSPSEAAGAARPARPGRDRPAAALRVAEQVPRDSEPGPRRGAGRPASERASKAPSRPPAREATKSAERPRASTAEATRLPGKSR